MRTRTVPRRRGLEDDNGTNWLVGGVVGAIILLFAMFQRTRSTDRRAGELARRTVRV